MNSLARVCQQADSAFKLQQMPSRQKQMPARQTRKAGQYWCSCDAALLSRFSCLLFGIEKTDTVWPGCCQSDDSVWRTIRCANNTGGLPTSTSNLSPWNVVKARPRDPKNIPSIFKNTLTRNYLVSKDLLSLFFLSLTCTLLCC